MSNKFSSLVKSRRFWVAAIGLGAVISEETFNIQLDQEQVLAITSIVVAWILGDTIRQTQ